MFPAHSADLMRAYARSAPDGREVDRNAAHLRALKDAPRAAAPEARPRKRLSPLRHLLALHAALSALRT